MSSKKNVINTFKNARKYTTLIEQKAQSMPSRIEYKKEAKIIPPTQEYIIRRDSIGEEGFCTSPLSSFRDRLSKGLIPTIESMWVISECFGKYLDAEGTLELEEVFFGKPKKSLGNFSARRALEDKELPIIHIHIAMFDKWNADANEAQMTDIEIVEDIIRRYPDWGDKDPDSVLRTYRRKVKDPDSILRGFVKKKTKK